MGGDFRGGKRHRREDGSHMRGGGGNRGLNPNAPPAMNQELREMRDAIIHCDGSPEMCRNLSGLLAHDLPALTEPALKFIMECVQELPVKTPVYATLVGLLNPKVPAFVEDVVRDAIERIEATLRSDDVSDRTRARLLLRFVALLPSVGVMEPSAAVDVLDAVVCAALAAADAAEPGWQPRADFLVYAVLAVMPWAGRTLALGEGEGTFERLMQSVEEYLGKRRQGPDPAAMIFASDATDDWLEEIWGRVNEVRKAGHQNAESWTVRSVPPVTMAFEEELREAGGDKHVPPPLAVPNVSYDGPAAALAAFPVRPRLRILSQSMTEGMWEAGDWGPLERFVAEEYVVDTLWAFEPGFRRGTVIPAAEQLGTLPLPGDHPERCQFLVAETLFGEMLALPRPPHAAVFYHVVIQDLCKTIQTFPKMMAKMVGQMFTQMARMDVEARERLADWMAHHLSCFDLAWPWRSWAHVADQPADHPQRAFCASVVRRLQRLCYHDRVKESLPEELRALLPGKPSLNPDYIHDALNASSGALNDLRAMMRDKTSADKVMEWFETSGKLQALGNETAARILTVAALQHGQKCITHHNVLLGRYESALRALVAPGAGDDDDRGCAHAVVAAAAGVWNGTHPQMAVVAVSRLLELGVVTSDAVARWAAASAASSGPDASDRCDRGVAWGTPDAFDIARIAVDRLAADREARGWYVRNIKRDIAAASQKLAQASAKADGAERDGAMVVAARHKDAKKRHLDRVTELEKQLDAAKAPFDDAEAATSAAAATLATAMVTELAPRMAAAAAEALAPTPTEAGKDAAPETRDARALSMCVALLRRFRAELGAGGEAAVAEAIRGAGVSEDVAKVFGEAVSGRGTVSR